MDLPERREVQDGAIGAVFTLMFCVSVCDLCGWICLYVHHIVHVSLCAL